MIEFLLSAMVFYILLAIGIIAIIFNHEKENLGWANFLFTLILVYCFWKFANFDFKMLGSPEVILKWIGLYIVVGIVWAICKWYFFLRNIINTVNQAREKYSHEFEEYKSNRKEHTDKSTFIWEKLYEKFSYRNHKVEIRRDNSIQGTKPVYKVVPPDASENKMLITTWMLHWPVSCVWTLINDPIKKLINHIFEMIKSIFQSMSNSMFKSLNQTNDVN